MSSIHSYHTFFGVLILIFLQPWTSANSEILPRFKWPVACEINRTCFIQNYVDLDPSPNVKDFACEAATYDGHRGTDIRLLSNREVEKSVAVLAAAQGKIKATRDGVHDQLIREINPSTVADKECGNGVVIDHGLGWESQYCHLREGSVRVRAGDEIEAGRIIASVGYSGLADFAHLHFEIRHNGKPVDPFINQEQSNFCKNEYEPLKSLWQDPSDELAKGLKGQIIEATFSGTIPDLKRIEYGDAITPPSPQSSQLIFMARMINLHKGDLIRSELTGPLNFNGISEEKPLDKNKATYVFFSGRRLKEARWPSGTYRGTLKIVRNNLVVLERMSEMTLP